MWIHATTITQIMKFFYNAMTTFSTKKQQNYTMHADMAKWATLETCNAQKNKKIKRA